MIGVNYLLESLCFCMVQLLLVVVEDLFDVCFEWLCEEYFDCMYCDFIVVYGEEKGWQVYGEYLYYGLFVICCCLGLQCFVQFIEWFDEVLVQQQCIVSIEVYFVWLVLLLEEYYDLMYCYQLGKKVGKIFFCGSWQEVVVWLVK